MADQPLISSLQRVVAPDYPSIRPTSNKLRGEMRTAEPESEKSRFAGEILSPEKPRPVQELATQSDLVRLVRDDESGRSFVQILDRRTGEVIYQIPPEAVRKLAVLAKDVTGTVIDTVA